MLARRSILLGYRSLPRCPGEIFICQHNAPQKSVPSFCSFCTTQQQFQTALVYIFCLTTGSTNMLGTTRWSGWNVALVALIVFVYGLTVCCNQVMRSVVKRRMSPIISSTSERFSYELTTTTESLSNSTVAVNTLQSKQRCQERGKQFEEHKQLDLSYSPWSSTWTNSIVICAVMANEHSNDILEWLSYHRFAFFWHQCLSDSLCCYCGLLGGCHLVICLTQVVWLR